MRSIWILPIGWLIASACLGRLLPSMGTVVVTERSTAAESVGEEVIAIQHEMA
jgi:hypothetical protein